MKTTRHWLRSAWVAALCMVEGSAVAADYPPPKEADWTAPNFKFHTGETMPELKLHYTTVGEASGTPVVVLHGSGGSAQSMLTPGFAGELFGPGQPFDAAKYYIVIPDALGHGGREGDHVMLGGALDLLDPCNIEPAPLANVPGSRGRHDSGVRHRVGRSRLDPQPRLVAALVAPDAAHLRVCVTGDHDDALLRVIPCPRWSMAFLWPINPSTGARAEFRAR